MTRNHLGEGTRPSARAATKRSGHRLMQLRALILGDELIGYLAISVSSKRNDFMNPFGPLANQSRYRQLVERSTEHLRITRSDFSNQLDGGLHIQDNQYIEKMPCIRTQVLDSEGLRFPQTLW